MTTKLRALAIAAVAAATLTAAIGCGEDSKSSDSSTTTEAMATTTTVAETTTTTPDTQDFKVVDKAVQAQLITVGCYTGQIDGILGPKTDAAIVKFQQGANLPLDGELNEATSNALDKASSAKLTVCKATPASTTTTTPRTTTTFAPNDAACTVTALTSAIGGDPSTTLSAYKCQGSYAAFIVTGAPKGNIAQARNGAWVIMDQAAVCNSTTTTVPLALKQIGCTGNGN